ncbi:hypothetical protein EYF80_016504 [Liparis tanakae]|uniref:Uncharacterized protein n=1 Tax=Liparis tanakae TaxID=230148 RepID=A0A4Z2I6H4_9TELE|nr:hypothetical protein EYF80_016504 [Liparis tanakae]
MTSVLVMKRPAVDIVFLLTLLSGSRNTMSTAAVRSSLTSPATPSVRLSVCSSGLNPVVRISTNSGETSRSQDEARYQHKAAAGLSKVPCGVFLVHKKLNKDPLREMALLDNNSSTGNL